MFANSSFPPPPQEVIFFTTSYEIHPMVDLLFGGAHVCNAGFLQSFIYY